MLKCDKCGRNFMPGNTADGLPKGITYKLKDGKYLTICSRCIVELGNMDTDQEREQFFKELGDV